MSSPPKAPRDEIIKVAFLRSLRVIGLGVLVVGALVVGLQLIKHWLQPEVEVVTEDASVDLSGLFEAGNEPKPPEALFVDITQAAGIDFVHTNGAYGERLLPETMGGGVAFLDFDQDGDQDLLFINSNEWAFSPQRTAQNTLVLYANDGNGQFEDVTDAVGLSGLDAYGMGVAAGDFNGDGFVDLFVTAVGENALFENQSGLFREVTDQAGVAGDPEAWSTGAAFFDANQDGHLDLYVTNYVQWSRDIDIEVDYRLTGIGRAYGPPSNFEGTQPFFYLNRGDGTFVEMAESAGFYVTNPITQSGIGKGLAVIPMDINDDSRIDLVVANDTVRNFAFLNNTSGGDANEVRFEEVGTQLGLGFDRNGMATGAMGMDFAHFRNDEALAIAIGNFANEMSSFYVNQDPQNPFNDQSIGVGVGAATRLALTFGVFFFDYDLDGRLDYLQANGHVENDINRVQASQTHAQRAQLFWNCGLDCNRQMIAVTPEHMGDLAHPIVGRGAAYGDIDQDGDLDVVLTQIAGPPLLLRNDQSSAHHWLGLVLRGNSPNTQAIGARVELYQGEARQVRHVMPTRSYLSQVSLPMVFGLGSDQAFDQLIIHWPDGQRQAIEGLTPDRYHTIDQPNRKVGQ